MSLRQSLAGCPRHSARRQRTSLTLRRATMETNAISRRQVLKGAGALIVSFSMFERVSRVLAQSAAISGAEPDPASLDSWLAVAPDGIVTVFTSKVELGTGTETALAQIVAEELDVPFG